VQAAARQVPNLTLKGFLPFEEAAREFARAKLFINTSDLEGFPTTYLQAWQRGVPVISFVNPDDLINPNRLGKVVKNLDEMSAALRDFSDGKLQFSNAHIEQFFQAHFTIQAAVDQYEKVFRSVLEINS
ncbi:MAG: glycosyltransferase, partial [Calditrichaeota bacterium]|nr:glycosyltransferase [Calditrichota bacterium]